MLNVTLTPSVFYSVMIEVVSLLLLEELCEVGVAGRDSFLSVLLLLQLRESKVAAVKHLASLSSLLLLDVICVRVSEEE